MNIAIFTDTFLPEYNGVSTSLVQLVKGLVAEKHSVLVIAPKMVGSDQNVIPGALMHFVPSVQSFVYPESKIGLFSPKLVSVLRKFNADIIHTTTPSTLGFTGVLYGKLTNKPVFGVFHTYFMEPEYLKIIGLRKLVSPINKMLWRFAKDFYNRCDYVISPSEYVAQDLAEHGVVRDITVIHNTLNISDRGGVSDVIFKEKLAQLRQKKRKYLLYIGRVSKEKSIDVLLKAFFEVTKRHSDVDLLLVGGGPELAQLQSLARELGITNRVKFFGMVSHDDLLASSIFSLATCFVTMSTSEVQPMSIIEAMYSRLPIIACKSKGMVEMIDGNGVLVEPGNTQAFAAAVDSLLADERLRKKLQKRSKELTKEFLLTTVVQKHCALYEQALRENT